MKILVNICRAFVGILFIISGLVKANDPMGLSYKMEEFFEVWGVSALNSFSLWLSVLVIAFEIIAGIALLLGWKPKWMNWLLLVLIVFFTILTGYAYVTGKITNCGCFGDCIPLTSGGSFVKDIFLLVLILFLFFNRKYIKPLLSNSLTWVVLVLTALFSFAFQWYTLHYLPVVDCLPFKRGNSIPKLMVTPENSIPDSTVITFEYEKKGRKVEFTVDQFPNDFNENDYTFIKRYDKVIKEGKNNKPLINGFFLQDATGGNNTQLVLSSKAVLLLFIEDMSRGLDEWQHSFENLYKVSNERGLQAFIVTATRSSVQKAIELTGFKKITILDGDRTLIRTAARTNPTVYILKEGIVAGKWSYKNFMDAAKYVLNGGARVALPPASNHPDTGEVNSTNTITF